MSAVTLCECFARDGLQHEPAFVPTATKRALVERFAALGFPRVEATSYSNPKVVPQFADASELFGRHSRKPGVFYKATCANVKAVERALADLDAGHGANEISLLVSATESHTQKNLNRSRAEQWQNIAAMVERRRRALPHGRHGFGGLRLPVRGQGRSRLGASPTSSRFRELGVTHVALGDTTGMATPASVKDMFERIRKA